MGGGERWQRENGGMGWLLSGIHSQGAEREQQKDQAVELKVRPPGPLSSESCPSYRLPVLNSTTKQRPSSNLSQWGTHHTQTTTALETNIHIYVWTLTLYGDFSIWLCVATKHSDQRQLVEESLLGLLAQKARVHRDRRACAGG